MNRDTLNKFVADFKAVSFVFPLLDRVVLLADALDTFVRLNNKDELEAFIGVLDNFNPNDISWLAWQIIKALAQEGQA